MTVLGSESYSTCTQFQNLITMSELAIGVHILSSPCPVGQDWHLLPEGAQPPYGDHNSLLDPKASYHRAVNTNVWQPSQGNERCILIQIQVHATLSHKSQLQNLMHQFQFMINWLIAEFHCTEVKPQAYGSYKHNVFPLHMRMCFWLHTSVVAAILSVQIGYSNPTC